jgi:hypothetical protein
MVAEEQRQVKAAHARAGSMLASERGKLQAVAGAHGCTLVLLQALKPASFLAGAQAF